MKIRIRRIDPTLPLPEYHTEGAVAFDLASRERVTIEPGKTAFIPLNVALEVPEGYFALLAPRSSTPKKGIMFANSIGIIDRDYSGNNDEYKIFAYNFTDAMVTIERGDRVAQVVLVSFVKADIEEVNDLGHRDRGGFGTTGA